MNHFKKANRVLWHLIEAGRIKVDDEGKSNIVLFPLGGDGMMIRNLLHNRYGIQEAFVVDNKLATLPEGYRKAVGVHKLKDMDISDKLFLITSDQEKTYSEIRYQLMQYVDIKQIVDVFSRSMYFDPSVYYDAYDYKGAQAPRINALEAAAREIYSNQVEGAIAECGVHRGFFANQMSRLMPDRKLYLFDTFCGFDERDITETEEEDSGAFRKTFNFADTSVQTALNNIGYRANAIIRQGYFPGTAKGLENETFAFVSLDTDLYKPILAGLEFFWPRLNPGGVIFVDDFGHTALRGTGKAVIEFCKREKIGYVNLPDGIDSTAVLAKPL